MSVPPNSSDWYAHVKYKDDSLTEIVRVCNISYAVRGRDGKVRRFEPWRPKSLEDIDKSGYNYHVLTSLKTKNNENERFYAVCGKLATTREALLALEKGVGKDRIRYPANLPVYSDSATEAEGEEEVSAVTLLEAQKAQKRKQDNLRTKATAAVFSEFLTHKQISPTVDSGSSAKRPKTTDDTSTLPSHDTSLDESVASTSMGSASVDSMQLKIVQLQTEILELEKRREALSGFDLKSLIRDAVKDIVKPELDSVKTVVTSHVSKISALDSKIDEFSELISKSPRKAKIQYVQRWVDSIV